MSKSTFEEQLDTKGILLYTNVGDSMLPLIREHSDVLIIKKNHGRLKKYDVPLYKRDSGQYVLHRIIKVREEDYVICGDNRYSPEYGITDRHIIGVLTGLIRDGKELSVTDLRYRIYVMMWCGLFPLRCIFLKGLHFMKRVKNERKK